MSKKILLLFLIGVVFLLPCIYLFVGCKCISKPKNYLVTDFVIVVFKPSVDQQTRNDIARNVGGIIEGYFPGDQFISRITDEKMTIDYGQSIGQEENKKRVHHIYYKLKFPSPKSEIELKTLVEQLRKNPNIVEVQLVGIK